MMVPLGRDRRVTLCTVGSHWGVGSYWRWGHVGDGVQGQHQRSERAIELEMGLTMSQHNATMSISNVILSKKRCSSPVMSTFHRYKGGAPCTPYRPCWYTKDIFFLV